MEQPEAARKEPTEYERFEQLAKRLFGVPAEEIRQKQAESRADEARPSPEDPAKEGQ
jgi:hypothetical protein